MFPPCAFQRARAIGKLPIGIEPATRRRATSITLQSPSLLDAPPGRRGVFDEADVRRLQEFGSWIRRTFATDLAAGAHPYAEPNREDVFLLRLPYAPRFSIISLGEDIRFGQRVESFAVDAWKSGHWGTVARGTTIGYKRLLKLPVAVTASRLRVRILRSGDAPRLAKIGLYR